MLIDKGKTKVLWVAGRYLSLQARYSPLCLRTIQKRGEKFREASLGQRVSEPHLNCFSQALVLLVYGEGGVEGAPIETQLCSGQRQPPVLLYIDPGTSALARTWPVWFVLLQNRKSPAPLLGAPAGNTAFFWFHLSVVWQFASTWCQNQHESGWISILCPWEHPPYFLVLPPSYPNRKRSPFPHHLNSFINLCNYLWNNLPANHLSYTIFLKPSDPL